MNIRSQGVPLKSRYIREDADRFHPRSDGADFSTERDDYIQDLKGDDRWVGHGEESADDFPIGDEPLQADHKDMKIIRNLLGPIAIEENRIYWDCNRKAQQMINAFMEENPDRLLDSDAELRHAFRLWIDKQKAESDANDEPESVPCTTIGTCNGWRRAHESAVKVGRLEAEVQRLESDLAYTEKRLADMTECRDDWKRLCEKMAKEATQC